MVGFLIPVTVSHHFEKGYNSDGDLLTTLKIGESFGELTFFPDINFQSYKAIFARPHGS